MPRQPSPGPQWASFQEPDPSSSVDATEDELDSQMNYEDAPVPSRKRKSSSTENAAKRRKFEVPAYMNGRQTESSADEPRTGISNSPGPRHQNAVAGPSRLRPSPPPTAPIPTPRPSISQAAKKPILNVRKEGESAAKTKVVKRTRREKERQQSEDDSSPPPVPTLASVAQRKATTTSSKSAPLPRGKAPPRKEITESVSTAGRARKASGSTQAAHKTTVSQLNALKTKKIARKTTMRNSAPASIECIDLVVSTDDDDNHHPTQSQASSSILRPSTTQRKRVSQPTAPSEVFEISDSDDPPAPTSTANINKSTTVGSLKEKPLHLINARRSIPKLPKSNKEKSKDSKKDKIEGKMAVTKDARVDRRIVNGKENGSSTAVDPEVIVIDDSDEEPPLISPDAGPSTIPLPPSSPPILSSPPPRPVKAPVARKPSEELPLASSSPPARPQRVPLFMPENDSGGDDDYTGINDEIMRDPLPAPELSAHFDNEEHISSGPSREHSQVLQMEGHTPVPIDITMDLGLDSSPRSFAHRHLATNAPKSSKRGGGLDSMSDLRPSLPRSPARTEYRRSSSTVGGQGSHRKSLAIRPHDPLFYSSSEEERDPSPVIRRGDMDALGYGNAHNSDYISRSLDFTEKKDTYLHHVPSDTASDPLTGSKEASASSKHPPRLDTSPKVGTNGTAIVAAVATTISTHLAATPVSQSSCTPMIQERDPGPDFYTDNFDMAFDQDSTKDQEPEMHQGGDSSGCDRDERANGLVKSSAQVVRELSSKFDALEKSVQGRTNSRAESGGEIDPELSSNSLSLHSVNDAVNTGSSSVTGSLTDLEKNEGMKDRSPIFNGLGDHVRTVTAGLEEGKEDAAMHTESDSQVTATRVEELGADIAEDDTEKRVKDSGLSAYTTADEKLVDDSMDVDKDDILVLRHATKELDELATSEQRGSHESYGGEGGGDHSSNPVPRNGLNSLGEENGNSKNHSLSNMEERPRNEFLNISRTISDASTREEMASGSSHLETAEHTLASRASDKALIAETASSSFVQLSHSSADPDTSSNTSRNPEVQHLSEDKHATPVPSFEVAKNASMISQKVPLRTLLLPGRSSLPFGRWANPSSPSLFTPQTGSSSMQVSSSVAPSQLLPELSTQTNNSSSVPFQGFILSIDEAQRLAFQSNQAHVEVRSWQPTSPQDTEVDMRGLQHALGVFLPPEIISTPTKRSFKSKKPLSSSSLSKTRSHLNRRSSNPTISNDLSQQQNSRPRTAPEIVDLTLDDDSDDMDLLSIEGKALEDAIATSKILVNLLPKNKASNVADPSSSNTRTPRRTSRSLTDELTLRPSPKTVQAPPPPDSTTIDPAINPSLASTSSSTGVSLRELHAIRDRNRQLAASRNPSSVLRSASLGDSFNDKASPPHTPLATLSSSSMPLTQLSKDAPEAVMSPATPLVMDTHNRQPNSLNPTVPAENMTKSPKTDNAAVMPEQTLLQDHGMVSPEMDISIGSTTGDGVGTEEQDCEYLLEYVDNSPLEPANQRITSPESDSEVNLDELIPSPSGSDPKYFSPAAEDLFSEVSRETPESRRDQRFQDTPFDLEDAQGEEVFLSSPTSLPPSLSPSPDIPPSPVIGPTFGEFKALTWDSFRQNLNNFTPKYHLAKDLPHALQDHINSMSEETRQLSQMRHVFEADIQENTAADEPDAPLIQLINEVDSDPTPPWEFHYTNMMWHGEGVPAPDVTRLTSCDCVGKCDPRSKTCACLQRQKKYIGEGADFAYDSKERLKEFDYPIFECNELCRCGDECRNRVVQHGRKVSVNIAKTHEKGWGVFAGAKKIYKGSFIGVYAGELLTDEVGEERGIKYNKFGRTYLFDLDFHHLKEGNPNWETKYVVDAYHAGNFTRFLNHSCDPNCKLNPCYINESNIDKPLLTVFARRDIEPFEELCFSYSGDINEDEYDENDIHSSPGMKKRDEAIYVPCVCGARNCTGVMFK